MVLFKHKGEPIRKSFFVLAEGEGGVEKIWCHEGEARAERLKPGKYHLRLARDCGYQLSEECSVEIKAGETCERMLHVVLK